MARIRDNDASKSPDDLPRGNESRAPHFSTMDAARRREHGFKPRPVREIAKDVMVRHAETLKRLGE